MLTATDQQRSGEQGKGFTLVRDNPSFVENLILTWSRFAARACTGVWFMHCHLEVHVSWGLKMAWLVLDGERPNEKLLPPPSDLPTC